MEGRTAAATAWLTQRAYLLIPVAVVTALATIGMEARTLWYDELVTADAVENGLSGLFAHSWEYPLTPYYALVYVWTLGGTMTPDWWLRGLSVMFAASTVLVTGLTGELLHSRRVGFVAAFVVSVSPWMAYYSQTARSYALGSFLVAASTYFAVSGARNNRQSIWLPYAAVIALAAVFVQTALIALVVHPVVFALSSRDRAWVKPWLKSVLVTLPVIALAAVMYTSKGTAMHGWLDSPSASDLWKGLPQVTRWEPLALILICCAVLTRQGLAWLAGVVVGIVSIWAVSQIGASFWLDGVLGMLISVFALAAASTFVLVSWRFAVLWCAFVAVVSVGHLIQMQNRVDNSRYAATVASIVASKGDDATIATDPNKVLRMALRHYAPQVRVTESTDASGQPIPGWHLGEPQFCLGAESTNLESGLTLTFCPA